MDISLMIWIQNWAICNVRGTRGRVTEMPNGWTKMPFLFKSDEVMAVPALLHTPGGQKLTKK